MPFLSDTVCNGTPDSLLLTHGLSLTTGQHGGRYDPQPVTHSSEFQSFTEQHQFL